MTGPSMIRARKPSHGPTSIDLAERDRFAEMVENSLPSIRSSAEAWRNGLAAYIALVTTGVVIKGQETTAHLSTGAKLAVTILIGGGIALSLVGLWQALGAQAGSREGSISFEEITRRHASVTAYHVALALDAAKKLRHARLLVAVALGLLLLGVITTWWAPGVAASPPAYLKITYNGNGLCGTLLPGDDGLLRLALADGASVAVPVAEIQNLSVVRACA